MLMQKFLAFKKKKAYIHINGGTWWHNGYHLKKMDTVIRVQGVCISLDAYTLGKDKIYLV